MDHHEIDTLGDAGLRKNFVVPVRFVRLLRAVIVQVGVGPTVIIGRSRQHSPDFYIGIDRLHQLGILDNFLAVPCRGQLGVVIAIRAVVRYAIIDRVTVAPAVIAGAECFVADFPILDAHRRGAIDRQERVVAVVDPVGLGPRLIFTRSRSAELRPIAGRLPIVPLLIDADHDVVGCAVNTCVGIGVGHPRGGFFGLPPVVGNLHLPTDKLHRRTIVDGHHRFAVFKLIEQPDESVKARTWAHVAKVGGLTPPGRQTAPRDATFPLRPRDRPVQHVGIAAAAVAQRGHAGLFQPVVHERVTHVVVIRRRMQSDPQGRHDRANLGRVDGHGGRDLRVKRRGHAHNATSGQDD